MSLFKSKKDPYLDSVVDSSGSHDNPIYGSSENTPLHTPPNSPERKLFDGTEGLKQLKDDLDHKEEIDLVSIAPQMNRDSSFKFQLQ